MEQLIRLQNIDTKLKDLNDLLGDLPSKVEDLNNQEKSTKNSIVKKKSRSKELDLEIKKTEQKENLKTTMQLLSKKHAKKSIQ